MNEQNLKKLLADVKKGRVDIHEAVGKLRSLPYEDLGFAKIDHHRSIRTGVPEVIFCQGKTKEQIIQIAGKIISSGHNVLATRVSREVYKTIKEKFPKAKYHETARIITIQIHPIKKKKGLVSVFCAGTSDIPVADEAAVTAEFLGCTIKRVYDVGVAGIHRLLDQKESILSAKAIIVVAGMDGALPSVVGGLASCPVIAVPTSVGYGASFGGLSALLTMLNSCASGVAVVNIDNGFGAGYFASLI